MSMTRMTRAFHNADALSKGDFHVVARAISLVENSRPGAEELLEILPHIHVPVLALPDHLGPEKHCGRRTHQTNLLLKEETRDPLCGSDFILSYGRPAGRQDPDEPVV